MNKNKLPRQISGIGVGLLLASLVIWPVAQGFAAVPQLQITIEGQSPYFQPVRPVVLTGFTIRWNNPTATEHTITHDACSGGGPCMFDSGVVPPNGSFTLAGLPPGQYPYHCRLHPIMRGVLRVLDNDGSAATDASKASTSVSEGPHSNGALEGSDRPHSSSSL